MIRVTGKIPRRVAVAVSGGIDSMAALDFLRRSHEVVVLHYNHGTPYAPKAEALVRGYCIEHQLTLVKRGGETKDTNFSQRRQVHLLLRHTILMIKWRTGSLPV